jgi:hypothetical protein
MKNKNYSYATVEDALEARWSKSKSKSKRMDGRGATPIVRGKSPPVSGHEDRIEQAIKIVRDEMIDCGCEQGSFIYGCRHTRRRLLEILQGLPKVVIE